MNNLQTQSSQWTVKFYLLEWVGQENNHTSSYVWYYKSTTCYRCSPLFLKALLRVSQCRTPEMISLAAMDQFQRNSGSSYSNGCNLVVDWALKTIKSDNKSQTCRPEKSGCLHISLLIFRWLIPRAIWSVHWAPGYPTTKASLGHLTGGK